MSPFDEWRSLFDRQTREWRDLTKAHVHSWQDEDFELARVIRDQVQGGLMSEALVICTTRCRLKLMMLAINEELGIAQA